MEGVKTKPGNPVFQSSKYFRLIVILVILAVIGLSVFSAFNPAKTQIVPQTATVISPQMLEERYGLGVNLIAVTAAGGMVDLRLRIIDGEKAKTLLGDQNNFPTLHAGNEVILRASEDIASQTIKFEDGSNIFILYPNANNVVKPGDPISIVFGDIQVEAIQVK